MKTKRDCDNGLVKCTVEENSLGLCEILQLPRSYPDTPDFNGRVLSVMKRPHLRLPPCQRTAPPRPDSPDSHVTHGNGRPAAEISESFQETEGIPRETHSFIPLLLEAQSMVAQSYYKAG